MRKKILSTATILLLATIGMFAQSKTTASGGEASGSDGTVSYTVGQVEYQSYSGNGGTVSEGVQQAYEIFTLTRTESKEVSLVQVSAYPNPTTDLLQLEVESEKLKDLSYQLYDLQGSLLQNHELTNRVNQIDMGGLVPSTYFIKIISNNRSIKEFKIIKQ